MEVLTSVNKLEVSKVRIKGQPPIWVYGKNSQEVFSAVRSLFVQKDNTLEPEGCSVPPSPLNSEIRTKRKYTKRAKVNQVPT